MNDNDTPPEGEHYTLLDRCANQGARAIVKEIERHTGKPLDMYMTQRVINCLGLILSSTSFEGGPPGELRAILEQPYKRDAEQPEKDRVA